MLKRFSNRTATNFITHRNSFDLTLKSYFQLLSITTSFFWSLFKTYDHTIRIEIDYTISDVAGLHVPKSIPDISEQHNQRRPKSAQKKNELTLLYSALIKKFVSEVNSFAFNGNSLLWEHDCIFALPLR